MVWDKKRIIVLIILSVILPLVCSPARSTKSPYYADVIIDVSDSGLTSMTGTTNHPQLVGDSDNFTSKHASIWTLNITLQDAFSDYIYTIILPEDAEVRYVQTPGPVRITQENNRIVIISTSSDEPLSVVVQYSMGPTPQTSLAQQPYLPSGIALLCVIGIVLVYLRSRNKAALAKSASLPNLSTLTPRQRQILEFIVKHKNQATQGLLEKSISMPKSSLSRNVDSLVRKGILTREKRGISNILTLKVP